MGYFTVLWFRWSCDGRGELRKNRLFCLLAHISCLSPDAIMNFAGRIQEIVFIGTLASPTILYPDEFCRPNRGIAWLRPPPSCRDKGWMWRWVGALCLSWWQHDSPGFRMATWSHSHQDKHKAPSSTPPRPLSLQKGTPSSPLLHSVVKVHQDRGGRSQAITPFGCQKSEDHTVCVLDERHNERVTKGHQRTKWK